MSSRNSSVTICNTLNKNPMIKDMTKKDVLTAEEVAEYLRVHPYTLRRLVRAGKLPGFKVGGQWRFRKNVIDKWSENYRLKNKSTR